MKNYYFDTKNVRLFKRRNRIYLVLEYSINVFVIIPIEYRQFDVHFFFFLLKRYMFL